MRFGLVHQVMTSLLAALGVLAVVSSGELGRWTNIGLLVGLALALAVPESWHAKPWLNRLANGGPLVLLVVQVARYYFFNRSLLEVAVEFAAVLQLVRLATRRGAAHDQQVIVLALIHLIAGTVLGSGLGYGLCFLGFLVVAPGALVLSHLRREVEGNYRQGARDRTGLPVDVPRILRSRRVVGRTFLLVTCSLVVPILLFTTVLFLFFPRVGLSILMLTRSHKRMVGFGDRVDLGGVGELRTNQAVALYVEVPDQTDPPPERVTLHLRGTAFDAFDGKSWSRSSVEWRPVPRQGSQFVVERPGDPSRDRLFKFDLEYYEPPVVFLPPNTAALAARSRAEGSLGPGSSLRLERGPEGQFQYRSGDERGLHYEVWVGRTALPQPTALGRDERARYLSLPPLPERISGLTQRWTEGRATSFDKARAIEERLRSDFRYDLATPSGSASAPLDHFLFESKRGHCEYYSSAMAVMLRQVGIPSRNVTGYIGGKYNRFSRNYVVRQQDAHSWVEAFIEGVGWVTFDPTPPANAAPPNDMRGVFALLRDIIEATSQRWDRHVVHYDLHQQLSMLERLQRQTEWVRSRMPSSQLGWRWVLVVAASGASVWGVWVLYRRFRPQPARRRSSSPSSAARSSLLAVALYEQLEAAMAQQGLGRPQGVPPLRHAESSPVRAHALGHEILTLTRLYLDVRFGGQSLSEAQRRDFEQRVRAVRAYKAPTQRA